MPFTLSLGKTRDLEISYRNISFLRKPTYLLNCLLIYTCCCVEIFSTAYLNMSTPTPKPPPDLSIPPSTSTVNIHVINTTSHISKIPTSLFVEPQYKGFEFLDCPAYSFLIEHPPTGRKFLFDLGVRKDWQNYSARIASRIKDEGWTVEVEKGVAEILQEGGVMPGDIEGIIWRSVTFL